MSAEDLLSQTEPVSDVEKWGQIHYVSRQMLDDVGQDRVSEALISTTGAKAERDGWTVLADSGQVAWLDPETDAAFRFDDPDLDVPDGCVVARVSVRVFRK